MSGIAELFGLPSTAVKVKPVKTQKRQRKDVEPLEQSSKLSEASNDTSTVPPGSTDSAIVTEIPEKKVKTSRRVQYKNSKDALLLPKNTDMSSKTAVKELFEKMEEETHRTLIMSNVILAAADVNLIKKVFSEDERNHILSIRFRNLPVAENLTKNLYSAVNAHKFSANCDRAKAYIVFDSHEVASECRKRTSSLLQGHPIFLEWAHRRDTSPVPYDPKRSVFIGCIPLQLTETEIFNFVSPKYGDVDRLRLFRDPVTFKSKGFANVCFVKRATATTMLKDRNNCKILGMKLNVESLSTKAETTGTKACIKKGDNNKNKRTNQSKTRKDRSDDDESKEKVSWGQKIEASRAAKRNQRFNKKFEKK